MSVRNAARVDRGLHGKEQPRRHFSLTGKRIFVAGHKGMVGSAIVRHLEATHDATILTASRQDCDLTRQDQVERWFARHKPDIVIDAAAKVGGILANDSYPADFLHENLMIQGNLIHTAHQNGVDRLLFLGSSCIYPKLAPQPMAEDSLLTGPLETTNQWYAIAKIAGLKMTEAYRRQHGRHYISAMPTNLYGPHDNFDLQNSHVLPALMRKMDEARRSGQGSVEIWGTGEVLREFLHVDDLARGCVFLLEHYDDAEHINIGTGQEVSIRQLAQTIKQVTGFAGTLHFNTDYPDGTPRKLMDSRRILAMGWQPRISLEAGIEQTYRWYLDQRTQGGLRGMPSQQAINA